jgi:U3 small nucleolar RNA-associated protein 4
VSDTHSLRLFELARGSPTGASGEGEDKEGEGEEWTLRKQDNPAGGVTCAHLLLFTPDGKVLVAVGVSGAVNVIDLESWEVMQSLKAHLPKHSAAASALEKAAAKDKAGKRKGTDPLAAKIGGAAGASAAAGAVARSVAVLSADVGCPAVSHACASADNQWLALVTTRAGSSGRRAAGVHVYNLDTLKLHASLPPPPGHAVWPPVAAMALSAAGVLALAVRDNALLAYDIESAQLAPWSSALAAASVAAPAELAALPGQICGLSFDPTPGSSVLLAQTPSAIARINLAVPPAVSAGTASKRRRRNKGGGGGDGGSELAMAYGKGGGGGGGSGGEIKVVKLDNPCLFLGYFAPGQALLVERPWADVLKSIPEPLYRHRFGT